jgi:hypothetical protein
MRLHVLLLAAVLDLAPLAVTADEAAPPAPAPDPVIPILAEETATAGIDHTYSGDWLYMVGGGAAAFDCDANGLPDLFLAGGEGPAALFRNVGTVGGPLRFARSDSGLEHGAVTGAYPLDVDSDGITDLILLRVGENLAMRGIGDCRFEVANAAWGFDGGDGWSAALAATWEKGQSWPTIAVGNYIDRTQEAFPWGSCTDNWLHRPLPSGAGLAPPLPLTPGYCALSMLFTDWNGSGTPSLRISNDREYYRGGQEQLWHLPPGQPPRAYAEADGWAPLRIWGMGIAAQDLTGDGLPDYFLTSMADSKLQALAPDAGGRPVYADIAWARGVTAHRPYMGDDLRPSTGWHAEFQDMNNDARPDLFVAKGNVAEMPDFAARDPNNLLLQRADGTFMESGGASGAGSGAISRGAALADFNLDGLVDLAVVNRWEPVQVWRNTGPAGNAIQVRPRQPGPNPDAIGGRLEVDAGGILHRRDITVGGGHAGGQLGWLHAGLGPATTARIRMIWPDGTTGPWQTVGPGFHILPRGEDTQAWTPGTPLALP